MLQNFPTFQKHTFTDIFEIIYPPPPFNVVNCQCFYAILLYLFVCACAMIVHFSGPYFTLRRNTLYSYNGFRQFEKLSFNYRKLYQSSLQKTFVYLNCHFHVILHYFESWILNEYFELLTT